jgi:hypothetical protein
LVLGNMIRGICSIEPGIVIATMALSCFCTWKQSCAAPGRLQ